jgi:hypothetical protein
VDEAGDDAVAIHGGAGILGGDEDVGLLAAIEPGITAAGDAQDAGAEVGLPREDVTVLANAGDDAFLLEGAEEGAQLGAVIAGEAELVGELDLVQGLVAGLAEELEDALAEGGGLGAGGGLAFGLGGRGRTPGRGLRRGGLARR